MSTKTKYKRIAYGTCSAIVAAAIFAQMLAPMAEMRKTNASANATPTTHNIYVDGTKVNGAAYEINGNNYFKLRDIAAMVNGSSKQFEVSWNEAGKRIDLTTGKEYTVVGGELALPSKTAKTAKESNATVYKDGAKASYTGYNISDNNYYKLRDLCKDMNIGVKWDEAAQRVDIITTAEYGKEDEAATPTPSPEPTPDPEPSTPSEPSTPTDSSNSSGSSEVGPRDIDYRQADDKGIKSVNVGSKLLGDKYYFYPSYGKYSSVYQDLLNTCGEEIVTKTLYYETENAQTTERGVLSGYPVQIVVKDSRIHSIDTGTYSCAMTFYVDEPKGEFQFKMPKSLLEKTLNSEDVFRIIGTNINTLGANTIINGRQYQIDSVHIKKTDVRVDNPTRMIFSLSENFR